jgi:hypothetical protein
MKRMRSSLVGLGLVLLALVAQLAVADLPAFARPDTDPVLAQLVALQTLCHRADVGASGTPAHPVPLHDNNCAICNFCAGAASPVLASLLAAGAPVPAGTPTQVVAFWPPATAPPLLRVGATGARAPPGLV